MAIPDYQSIFLPLLKLAGSGEEVSLAEAKDELAKQFRLSEEDRKALLPSGRQFLFDNRVGWARTYLNPIIITIEKKVINDENGSPIRLFL